ncbi:MAG: outer membrane beta-barrel protein [Bacteroidota bacterium]
MLKHLLTLLFLFTFSLNVKAQSNTQDMKLSLSGAPLIGSSDELGTTINGTFLKTSFGYYISNSTSIEISFVYAFYKDFMIDNIDAQYQSYAFVPSLRTHIVNKSSFRLFGEAGFGLGAIEYQPQGSGFETETFRRLSGGISIFSLGLGANYNFNSRFGMEILIPYIRTNNITSGNRNLIYSGLGPTIGLTFNLR